MQIRIIHDYLGPHLFPLTGHMWAVVTEKITRR